MYIQSYEEQNRAELQALFDRLKNSHSDLFKKLEYRNVVEFFFLISEKRK